MGEKGPLFMPHGSVRSIMALAVVLPLPLFVMQKVDVPQEYWGIVAVVIGLYFYNRNKDGSSAATPGQPSSEDIFSKLSVQSQEIEKINRKLDKPKEFIIPSD